MEQKRIAFYGKGGIGKTTLAANTAAELGRQGKKVLFIGCDPKSDSCMSLMGRRIPSVLELASELGTALEEDDIVFHGKYGVCCIEAGGPHAGAGCAGMGFNIMMSELERLEILEKDWDVIIYDVLGDVVCSGFSVPMRKKYADKIFVVTTSAYMAIYAANNILRSAVSLAPKGSNIAGGLILNRFRDKSDKDILDIYCQKTGVQCINTIDEDRLWGISECACRPLCELYPDSQAAAQLSLLAENVFNYREYPVPAPLETEAMDALRNELWKYYEDKQ